MNQIVRLLTLTNLKGECFFRIEFPIKKFLSSNDEEKISVRFVLLPRKILRMKNESLKTFYRSEFTSSFGNDLQNGRMINRKLSLLTQVKKVEKN